MNRNRQLAKANWDASRGNYSKYMRYRVDWRYPGFYFAPMGKRASASIIEHIECECDWKRMHRTRRSRRMLHTTDRYAKGRAATRRVKDTRRHEICIKCGFSRLHPRYHHSLDAYPIDK